MITKMKENIALTESEQNSFAKSVQKTKRNIKKGKIKITNRFNRRYNRFRKSNKGVVYLSNIPHGFYENELKGYFGQFGEIVKVRLARSKKTGRNKGYAFIVFKHKDVAEIAAETMNNYLMEKRLLKAKFLPFDKKAQIIFSKPNFSSVHFPTKINRLRLRKRINTPISKEEEKNKIKKCLKHCRKIQEKLKSLGINYNFSPVEMPKLKLKKNKIESKTTSALKEKTESKQNKKAKSVESIENLENNKNNETIRNNKRKKNKKEHNVDNINNKNIEKEESVNKKKIKTEMKKMKKHADDSNKQNNEKNINKILDKKEKKKEIKDAKGDKKKNNEKSDKKISQQIEIKTISKKEDNTKENEVNENKTKEKKPKLKSKKEKLPKNLKENRVGIKKKSKLLKPLKINNKKASLIKEQLKQNDQIKTVTKIEMKIKKKK